LRRNTPYVGSNDNDIGSQSTTHGSRSPRYGMRMPEHGGHRRRVKNRRHFDRRRIRHQRD
jgi:hypothetical protein